MDEKSLQNKHSTLLKRQKLLLNEKLIFTHYFNRVSEEEKKRSFTFEDYMKERLKDEKKISLLDIGKKYDVVHSELQNAHIKWENFEKKKDEKTDELLAQNQEVISHIKDIKMEVYELNRKIDTQSENKNGKISYDVFKKFFEDKFKKLENMIKKYKDNIESLNKQIVVATKKIEKKDSNNELQFIDFHQFYNAGGANETAKMHCYTDSSHSTIDNTHLSNAGAQKIAQMIAEQTKVLGLQLSDRLK